MLQLVFDDATKFIYAIGTTTVSTTPPITTPFVSSRAAAMTRPCVCVGRAAACPTPDANREAWAVVLMTSAAAGLHAWVCLLAACPRRHVCVCVCCPQPWHAQQALQPCAQTTGHACHPCMQLRILPAPTGFDGTPTILLGKDIDLSQLNGVKQDNAVVEGALLVQPWMT